MAAAEADIAAGAGAPPVPATIDPVLTSDGPRSVALLAIALDTAEDSWGLHLTERFDIDFPEGPGATLLFALRGGTAQVFYQPFDFARLDGENVRGTYMGAFEVWDGVGEAVLLEAGWQTHVTVFTYSGVAVNAIVTVQPLDPAATVPLGSEEIREWVRTIVERLTIGS